MKLFPFLMVVLSTAALAAQPLKLVKSDAVLEVREAKPIIGAADAPRKVEVTIRNASGFEPFQGSYQVFWLGPGPNGKTQDIIARHPAVTLDIPKGKTMSRSFDL